MKINLTGMIALEARCLWIPLEIGKGKLRLPEPKPWTLNIKTGERKYISPDQDEQKEK